MALEFITACPIAKLTVLGTIAPVEAAYKIRREQVLILAWQLAKRGALGMTVLIALAFPILPTAPQVFIIR